MVEEVEVSHLFMVHCDLNVVQEGVWLIDNGCSNHMTGMKGLFQELDETVKQTMSLGNDKEIQVAGRETVAIKSSPGKVRLLKDVQYVPHLAHNLLSISQ